VHREMVWDEIPPGDYEIFFRSTDGCETDYKMSFCVTSADAGEDINYLYCIEEQDTLDIWKLLDPKAGQGRLLDASFSDLDSAEMHEKTYHTVGEVKYQYITTTTNELPDTAVITIHVTDCNTCDYEITSSTVW